MTNNNGPFVVPGRISTISCYSETILPQRRNLKYREDSSSATPSSNNTAQGNYNGCIGRNDDPDVQRIDWYSQDEPTPYSLWIQKDGKQNFMDPPRVKCSHYKPIQTFSCSPCRQKFYKFDIDTPNTICIIWMDLGLWKREARVGYGWWSIENGGHPDLIGCEHDEKGAAEFARLVADNGGDLGDGIRRIERPSTLPPIPDFPSSAPDFVLIG